MKAYAKILIISACCILVGAVIAGIGFGLGARGFIFDGSRKFSPVSGSEKINISEELQAFSEAEIDVSCGRVKVVGGSDFGIEIHSSSSAFTPDFSVENGVLRVKSPEGTVFNLGMFYLEENYVTVTVPRTVLKVLSIESRAGSVEIENLLGAGNGKVTVRASAGGIEIKNLSGFDELEAESSAGGIELDGVTVAAATVDSSAGSVEIKDFAGSLDARSSAGGVDVALRDGIYSEEKFSVDLKTSAGSISVNDRKIKGSEYSFGRGSEYIIKIRASAGSIEFDAE